jgi:hypothetical protein
VHLALAYSRDRAWVFSCQSKQNPSRFLIASKLALEYQWLIDEVAAADVADRDYQKLAPSVAIKLARSRRSATKLPLGVSPEPSPVTPGNLLQWARHRDLGPPAKRVWPAVKPEPATPSG